MATTDLLLLRLVLSGEREAELHTLTESVLGPSEKRTSGPAVRSNDNTFTGGTTYERDARAKRVKPNSRCYSNAYTHQMAPNIVSPTPCIKIGDDPLDSSLKLRRDINLVCFSASLLCLPTQQDRTQIIPEIAAELCKTTGAVGFYELFDKHGNLLALPSVGRTLQYLFTNVQVNISPAASADGDGDFLNSWVDG